MTKTFDLNLCPPNRFYMLVFKPDMKVFDPASGFEDNDEEVIDRFTAYPWLGKFEQVIGFRRLKDLRYHKPSPEGKYYILFAADGERLHWGLCDEEHPTRTILNYMDEPIDIIEEYGDFNAKDQKYAMIVYSNQPFDYAPEQLLGVYLFSDPDELPQLPKDSWAYLYERKSGKPVLNCETKKLKEKLKK